MVSDKKSSHTFKLVLAVILPFALLALFRFTTFIGAENAMDCYYHVRIAESGPGTFMAKEFPPLTLSVWNKGFSDKEPLYHILLYGLRATGKAFGISGGQPFHFSSLCFTFAFLAAFVGTAYYFKVKDIYIFSLMLIFIAPYFSNRMLMLRPHVFSVALLLVATGIIAWSDRPRRCWAVILAGFVYAWSYSNPHFILFPALAFAVFRFPDRKFAALIAPAAAVIGIAFGYLLNPQFPNTFINWKIQCIDVVIQNIRGQLPIKSGFELLRPSLLWTLKNCLPLWLLTYVNLLLYSHLFRKKGFKELSPAVSALPVVAVFFVGCILLSKRAMEYAVPFTVLSSGLLFSEALRSGVLGLSGNYRKVRTAAFAVLVLLAIYAVTLAPYRRYTPLPRFADWMKKSTIPAGTLIANVVWTDFPILYYNLPQYRYLAGLDPMFAYASNPEEICALERFCKGKRWLFPDELKAITKADYAFISYQHLPLAKHLQKKGYHAIYDSTDGILFDLKASFSGDKATRKRHGNYRIEMSTKPRIK